LTTRVAASVGARYLRVPGARFLGILAAVLLVAQPVRAQQVGPDTPLPLDPQVTVGRLDNGLRYYVHANARPEHRAELRLVVNAGSVLEDDDQRGLAHFVEHMAFNGTESFERQELVQYLESIGMRFGPDLNAYTSFDETVYMLTVPTDDAQVVATAVSILAEWASSVSFDPAEVESERGVVIEEWRGRLGAAARLTDAQFPVLLRGSRYAERLPIGLRETLETFPVDALERFYERWYRPDLMAVIAVGDFDPAAVEAMIEASFGAIASPASPAARPLHEVPPHAGTLYLTTADPELTSTNVEVLHKLPPRATVTLGDYRRSLTERLYNGMLNTRLGEMTQRSNAPFLGAYSSLGGLVRGADVYVLAATVPEGGVERGLEAVLIEADRVARHGFVASELERYKLNMLRSLERAWAERERTNSGAYASAYVSHFLRGTPVPGIEFEYQLAEALLPGIGIDEVNGLAREWLTDENRVVLVSGPEKPDAPLPGEGELARVLAAAGTFDVEPYVDTVVDAPLVAVAPRPSSVVEELRHESIDATEWRLSNGVRVLLKATDFRDDEILMSAYAPGGLSLAADADYVSASFAADVVRTSGAGSFSLVELERALAGTAASAAPFIGELEQGFNGSASPRDLETLFQLVYLYFTEPRLDLDAGEALRDRLRAALSNRSADPNAAFSDTLQVTLSQHHPRFRPPTLTLPDELDLEWALDFYRERFSDASGFTFVFVGNLDMDALRPLVETYLGGLPTAGRGGESWRDTGVRAPDGVVERVVRQGLEPRATTRLIFTGEMPYTRENRYALRALADVLDMRLREVLREDLGGTYGVQVAGSAVSRPQERYTLSMAFGAAPEQLEGLVAALFEEVARLSREGPAEQDLARVREIQRRERETSLRQNGYWMGQIAGYDREGLDFADILTYERLIESLDPELIQRAARTLLSPDRYVRVSLLPAGGR